MRIIDARSGDTLGIGSTVEYAQGEKLTLLAVDVREWRAYIERTYRDYSKIPQVLSGETVEMVGVFADGHTETTQSPLFEQFDVESLPLVTDEVWVPLIVRRGDHPSFLGQDVAFIPS